QLAALRAIAAKHPNVRLALAFTRENGGDLHGRFHETHLADMAPWYPHAQTFLCGPESLQAAVREHYAAKGIEDSLHTEHFKLAVAVPAADARGEVRFGDTVVENSGATLLEQAESAGLTPEFGCRMGI